MGKEMKAFELKKKLDDLEKKISESLSLNNRILENTKIEAEVTNAYTFHSNVSDNRDKAEFILITLQKEIAEETRLDQSRNPTPVSEELNTSKAFSHLPKFDLPEFNGGIFRAIVASLFGMFLKERLIPKHDTTEQRNSIS